MTSGLFGEPPHPVSGAAVVLDCTATAYRSYRFFCTDFEMLEFNKPLRDDLKLEDNFVLATPSETALPVVGNDL